MRLCAAAGSAGELIDKCCGALVRGGVFQRAYLALWDDDPKQPRAVAQAGDDDRFCLRVDVLNEGALPECALALLPKNGGAAPCEACDPGEGGPGRLHRGLIHFGGAARGVLVVSGGDAAGLGDEARALVDEIVRAVGVGLSALRGAGRFGAERGSPVSHELLLDAIPAFVWYKDTDNRIIRCNRAAAESLGRTVADVEGESTETFYPEDAEKYYRDDLEVIRSGKPRRGIVEQLKTATGGKLWIRTDKIPFRGAGGAVEGIIVFAVDITDLKEKESQRAELEKRLHLAQKMEALGRLAGGVAHDLNNMLTPIMALSDLALHRAIEDSGLRDDIRQINEVARRVAALVRQLLNFGRQQVGHPKRVDLSGELARFEPILRRAIREDIRCDFRFPPLPGSVMADPAQLESIVVNLIANAQDAMPHGGELVVETRVERLAEPDKIEAATGVVPAGTWAVLSVRDTGHGMDETTRARMFEPLFTTKPHGRGTGLGLSTVQSIVLRYDGHILVDSAPGRGTKIEVWLPLLRGRAKAAATREETAAARGNGELVLVVEDQIDVRALADRILSGHGYEVLKAATAEEALRIVRENDARPQLLLSDVVLQGDSGIELAQRLQRELPGLRVLLMSGYASDVLADHGVPNTDVDLLPKPFTALQLLARVRSALDRA